MPFFVKVKTLTSKLGRKFDQRQGQQRQDDPHAPHGTKSTTPPVPAWQLQLAKLPSLKPVIVPKIQPDNQPSLATNGWTKVSYDTLQDPLYTSFQALLQAIEAFFASPDAHKSTFQTPAGRHASEEGWTRVEGEKEFITLRSLSNTPPELRDAATTYWSVAGKLLNEILGRVAESLDLPPEALTVFSEPCTELKEERTATMLRLFRYEGFEGNESRVVAEAHKDLGLLSLVIGSTPGLEVFDRRPNLWYSLERSYFTPAASLLVGRQLERLSNGRYFSGGHRVRSYPEPPTQPQSHTHPEQAPVPKSPQEGKKYRYSIVFVLRAHSPIPVNTDELTTTITGEFEKPIRDSTARELFRHIQAAHYNINTGIEERGRQKKKLAEKTIASTPPETYSDMNATILQSGPSVSPHIM